jgi:alpha-L-rhamnosidase
MVMNDSMPSYKYFIDKGLTALPEYWNYEDLWWGLARSRNHAMMGHVKEWFTRYLAGISLTEVGYDKIIIKPTIVENVSSVKGKVDTVHGVITSEYIIVDGKITMTIDLPVGVSANVYVPMLSEGGELLLDGAKVKGQLTEDGKYFVINNVISSGKYVIEVK